MLHVGRGHVIHTVKTHYFFSSSCVQEFVFFMFWYFLFSLKIQCVLVHNIKWVMHLSMHFEQQCRKCRKKNNHGIMVLRIHSQTYTQVCHYHQFEKFLV